MFTAHLTKTSLGGFGTQIDCLPPVPPWKRALDLSLASAALLLLSPVMLLVACLVRLTSCGPVLFRQTRIGRGRAQFSILKFRTMYECAPELLEDRHMYVQELNRTAERSADLKLFRITSDPRITPVGFFIRRYSLDELPQLINVLKGEMSLVGPRPALPWQVELLTAEQRKRHACLPGMTGLWQVSGRGRIDSAKMMDLDCEYARCCSLALDLEILLKTPRAVLLDRYTA